MVQFWDNNARLFIIGKITKGVKDTRCFCETQRPIPKIARVTRTNILIPEERSCHKIKVRESKHIDNQGKVLSLEIQMWNTCIKALALTVPNLLTRLKFSKNRSNSKVKVKW